MKTFYKGQRVVPSPEAEKSGVAKREGVVIGFSRDGCILVRVDGNKTASSFSRDWWNAK